MQKGFWDDVRRLGRPCVVLAPMANVTDAAFRRIIVKYSRYGGRDIGDGAKANIPAGTFRVGGPDVFWTEFVSADGLLSAGRERLLPDLWFTEAERPVVAQLFTAEPEQMKRAAEIVRKLGFDGVDINMGCPDRAVEKQGAGAALMKDPVRAAALIRAAREGAGGLPVSIKTRTGYRTNDIAQWLPRLLEAEPAAVIVHARTRNEMSKVPARWDEVSKAVAVVERAYAATPDERPLLIGNGDAASMRDAEERAQASGADGTMVGRGIFGNPWFFDRTRSGPPDVAEKLRVMLEHTRLFDELFRSGPRPVKNFDVMKKHYVAYVSGFPGAKELRTELMEASSADDVARIVRVRYPDGGPEKRIRASHG
ncbi:MAG: hypothetical protein RL681_50 [Candidatus Parcubacteria bacterium]|jgi:nifR3 family TIM-barrel protein